MRKIISEIVFCISVFIFQGCEKSNINYVNEKEDEEITNTISSCIGWFKNKDFELLYSIVAQDSNFLCVHPTNDVIKGYEHFLKNSEIFKNPDFIYVRHELNDLKINISKSGDVAWFFCILNDINIWKGQPANWENTRWTGVLEKENGGWVIQQMHFSFPKN